MKTNRTLAEWGEPRTGYNLYERHYASHMDDVEPLREHQTLDQKNQLIYNAKRWAHKKFPKLDHEEIDQEIDIKAWLLEEHELNILNEWERPKYVMTALKNTVHNYAKKEIGYSNQNLVTDTNLMKYDYAYPAIDEDFTFTRNTLKAALVIYLVAPYTLPFSLLDRIHPAYKALGKVGHKALLQTVLSPTYNATRDLNRSIDKILEEIDV